MAVGPGPLLLCTRAMRLWHGILHLGHCRSDLPRCGLDLVGRRENGGRASILKAAQLGIYARLHIADILLNVVLPSGQVGREVVAAHERVDGLRKPRCVPRCLIEDGLTLVGFGGAVENVALVPDIFLLGVDG